MRTGVPLPTTIAHQRSSRYSLALIQQSFLHLPRFGQFFPLLSADLAPVPSGLYVARCSLLLHAPQGTRYAKQLQLEAQNRVLQRELTHAQTKASKGGEERDDPLQLPLHLVLPSQRYIGLARGWLSELGSELTCG